MATINGVNCLELREGFGESVAEGGPKAGKSYLCLWNQRYQLANGILGLVSGSGSGGSVFLHAPTPYPESSNMWAQRVTIRGVGSISQGPKQIAWDYAAISVEYAIPSFSFSQAQDPGGVNSFDPSAPLIYATQSLSSSVEAITIPASTLKLSGGGPWNRPFIRYVGVVRMTLVLHRLPYLVSSTYRSKVGYLNSVAIWGCNPGNLRLDGFDTSRDYAVDGTVVQETTIVASFRPEAAWDYVYSNGWQQLQTLGGGSVIPSFDFNALIPTAYTANV